LQAIGVTRAEFDSFKDKSSVGVSYSLAPAAARAKKRASLRVKLSREALTDAALSQASWKDWYEEHQETLKEYFGEDADLFQKILGITCFATIPAEMIKDEVGHDRRCECFGLSSTQTRFDYFTVSRRSRSSALMPVRSAKRDRRP
jgi:hypothetical protein